MAHIVTIEFNNYLENRILSSDSCDNRAMIYVPNLITLLRIISVPFLVILLFNHNYTMALILFLCAGVSDGLDGYIAKRFKCVTKLGTMLDPIADKCLLITSFVMLTHQEYLPFWLTVIVVFRDLLIIGGVLFVTLLLGSVNLKPLIISKINTAVQILLIFVSLLNLVYPQIFPNIEWIFLYLLVAGTSILSGLAYIWQGSVLAMRSESGQVK